MNNEKTVAWRSALLLVLATFLWGTTFAAQRDGAARLDAYNFQAVRSFVGFFSLLPVVFLFGRKGLKGQLSTPALRQKWLEGSVICGFFMGGAALLQQIGIGDSTAGKAGFITAMYILIVPLIRWFCGQRIGKSTWVAVGMALWGMYRLCVQTGFQISQGDLAILACAFVYALQILMVDVYVRCVDGILLATGQLFFCGVFSALPLVLGFQSWATAEQIIGCAGPILFSGILSSGVAFTLQVIAQKGLAPTPAAIIMSLESVFGALAGWLLLQERFTTRELTGCILVFLATLLAQIPSSVFPSSQRRRNRSVTQRDKSMP